MGPLIDQELEQIDSKHNELMSLDRKLNDAFQLYTRLMKEGSAMPQYAATAPMGYAPQQLPSTVMPASYMPTQQQQTLPTGVVAPGMYPYNPHTLPQPQVSKIQII